VICERSVHGRKAVVGGDQLFENRGVSLCAFVDMCGELLPRRYPVVACVEYVEQYRVNYEVVVVVLVKCGIVVVGFVFFVPLVVLV